MATIYNLFPLIVAQKCQLCILRENSTDHVQLNLFTSDKLCVKLGLHMPSIRQIRSWAFRTGFQLIFTQSRYGLKS